MALFPLQAIAPLQQIFWISRAARTFSLELDAWQKYSQRIPRVIALGRHICRCTHPSSRLRDEPGEGLHPVRRTDRNGHSPVLHARAVPAASSSAQQHRAVPRSLRTRCVAVQPALEAALPSATAAWVDAGRRGAISAVSSPHRARGLVWRLLPVLRRGASPGTWCRW